MGFRVAVQWLHSCAGCEMAMVDMGPRLLTLLEEIELVHMPLLVDHKYHDPEGAEQPHIPAADLGIVTGAVAYHVLVASLEAEPSFISKFNTVAQILLGLVVIAMQIEPFMPSQGVWLLMGLVTVTTLASGIDYVWRWGRRARIHR